jgi:diguanylate cyclase (GGDEF)-like protein
MQTEEELNKLRAIVRIHQSIGPILDLTQIARIAVRELINIVGCDGCAILLTEDNKVKVICERGLPRSLGDMPLKADMLAIQRIASNRQSLFTGNVVDSPAADCVPSGSSIKSLICTPIITNDEVRGIVHLDSLTENAFSQQDLEFVEFLAKEVSVAVERSFLYALVQDAATRDALTGCYNRRKFDLDIVAEIARATDRSRELSLLMIDVDWFKSYNDFHGHQKGDVLLRKLGDILKSKVRASDSAYRYGGEEFAVLLPDSAKEKALSTATRLLRTVEREHFEGEEESQPNKQITISIGVATFPSDATNRDGLIEAADSALYWAKQSGRNQLCLSEAR